MADYLDPVVIRVKADVDDAIAKIRLLKTELDTLRNSTAKIKIKDDFNQAKVAAAGAAREVEKLGKDIGNADRDSNRFGASFKRLFADIRKGVGDEHGFMGKAGGFFKGLFKNIERGAKDAWQGVKDLRSGLSDLFQVFMSGVGEAEQLQASLNDVGNALAGIVAGIAESSPGLIVLASVIAALIIPVGALVSGLIAATGALAAGAIGVGALLAVGLPAVKNMMQGIQQLSQATNAYSEASRNLNTGLRTSKQDMAQYQAVLKGVDPNLRGAVLLLRNQNVQWQNLSASQRRSVVALSENNSALKGMSPAMKQALTALLNEKRAYDNLTPAQRRFAASLSGVSREWHAVQKAAQPVITLLLNDLVQLAKSVLPLVTPLINATGNAIHKLLVRADTFVKSEKFREWVKKLTNEIPGVISEVGQFISKLTGLIGPIVTNKKNLQDLHNTLTTVYNILQDVIKLLNACSDAFQGLKNQASSVIGVFNTIVGWLNSIANAAGAAAKAIESVMSAGASGGIGAALGAAGKALGFANGGVTPAGWRMVGERGPELEWSPGGDVILPNHHPVTQGAIHGYANGTGSLADDRPINVYVDGHKLFTILKNRTYGYNVNNGKRTPGGSATGVMAV